LDGSIYYGDSHEYTDAKNANDLGFELNMEIDYHITQEAKKIMNLPHWKIQNRWAGIYSQYKSSDIFIKNIDNNSQIVTVLEGKE